jgi:hypothetical protein
VTDDQPVSPEETPTPPEAASGAVSMPTGNDFIEAYSKPTLVSGIVHGDIVGHVKRRPKDDPSESVPNGPVEPNE